MIKNIVFGVFTASAISFTASAQDSFRWLTGTWKEDKKESYEKWEETGDHTLQGKGFKIVKNDTLVTEEVRLLKEDTHYYYIPDVAGDQGPVRFIIKNFTSTGFVAENLNHDFPTQIEYQFIASPQPKFIATISGKGKKISTTFQKIR